MKLYFVWIQNHANREDDEVLKVKARSKKEAISLGELYCAGRGGVSVERTMTREEFKKRDPWWHALLWGTRPHNEIEKRHARHR